MLATWKHLLIRGSRNYVSGCRICDQYSTSACNTELNTRELRNAPVVGQPTARTHPHLLKEGEVVPGIQLKEFRQRRSNFMESVVRQRFSSNQQKSHVVIIPAASKSYISDKIPYVFRQNTDFLYLTGCQEPDTILVLTTKKEGFTSTLFVTEKDEHTELWDGPRTGAVAAPALFGVDRALPLTEFARFFVSFLNETRQAVVWYDETNAAVQPNLHKKIHDSIKAMDGRVIVPPTQLLHNLRLIKSSAEIRLMKKSCEIASAAVKKTIQASRPGMSEHQLFATVDYECRMNGAEFLAYPPVVAAGDNANIIHYINDNQIIKETDMVLMDAGCEYHGYTSDITRTWPINGTFTREQKLLYEVVLDVQTSLIHTLEDMPSLDQLYRNMCSLLAKNLQEIGLIPKSLSGIKLLAATHMYCPHHVSHYLGMDVHDTGKISREGKVQPGMIVTVEPGLYINSKNTMAPPEFHGLGIRIEDDVLITSEGPVILTQSCPKDVIDMEALPGQN